MDKSWMNMDRRSTEYEVGVEEFLKVGVMHNEGKDKLRCPCVKCGNMKFQVVNEIRDHLFFFGIDQSYVKWIWHGEGVNVKKVNHSMPCERNEGNDYVDETIKMVHEGNDDYYMRDPKKFEEMLHDAEKPLYSDCAKYTRLSSIVKLYNLKAKYGWSDTSFNELLSLLADMLPNPNTMHSCLYEAKKSLRVLGMDYEKIHACPNDCILYRKEYASATCCPTCGQSRWKKCPQDGMVTKNGVPAKLLWYFPPIPRFRRMFRNKQIAKEVTWHANGRSHDGRMRHPVDTPSWGSIDHNWPSFKNEPRNLRLAISADGINPHRTLSSTYSCWPILMVTYNLPPWLCLKRRFIMLTLLISGPTQPGNDIDVYLSPLIDDLQILWHEGVECFDAFKQEYFRLRAILLWTINDFPAYGNLCGCTVKGYHACPICGDKTDAMRLKHSKSMAYMGHRKYLPPDHPYRRQKKAFNGNQEFDAAACPLTGEEILKIVEGVDTSYGKGRKKRKNSEGVATSSWKKKSIFFRLEYWKSLQIRHCLDVMHIEKNVCMNLINTLLEVPGKTRDDLNARLDLEELGIRIELAPRVGQKRTYIPPACHTLSRSEKTALCKNLHDLKVPDGYGSNFKNLVSMKDMKFVGLKSHDCHILMQQLFPVAIRSVLPHHVRFAIIRLCSFFQDICGKVVDVSKLEETQRDLIVTLCLFEKYFPPTFFTIMVHLTVHLVREVNLCGPVHYRWMYPFERFMKVLKGYVRNRNRPEGCISEAYVVEEALDFCTCNLSGVEPIGIPNTSESNAERPLSAGKLVKPSAEMLMQAHQYVLANIDVIEPYVE